MIKNSVGDAAVLADILESYDGGDAFYMWGDAMTMFYLWWALINLETANPQDGVSLPFTQAFELLLQRLETRRLSMALPRNASRKSAIVRARCTSACGRST